jgi:hypothetical protein
MAMTRANCRFKHAIPIPLELPYLRPAPETPSAAEISPLCTRLAVVVPESEPRLAGVWLPGKGLTCMSLLARSRRRFALVITLLTLLAPGRIFAVSCTTQAQMAETDRAALVQAARTLASAVQSGNVAPCRH